MDRGFLFVFLVWLTEKHKLYASKKGEGCDPKKRRKGEGMIELLKKKKLQIKYDHPSQNAHQQKNHEH